MDLKQRREYRAKLADYDNRKRKLKFVTIGGSLVTTVAIALEFFCGGVIRPKDAGYVFSSDSVTFTQDNPDDYTTKNYTVHFGEDGARVFTFEELEDIEPDVHGGYTYISSDNLPKGVNLGIQRVEDNPNKPIFKGLMFSTAIAGLGAAVVSTKEIEKIEEDEEDYKNRMRR